MLPSLNTTKFGFRIRTRHGLVVEHLMIHGRDEADAERKLRQMYLHCENLERFVMQPAMMQPTLVPPATVQLAKTSDPGYAAVMAWPPAGRVMVSVAFPEALSEADPSGTAPS